MRIRLIIKVGTVSVIAMALGMSSREVTGTEQGNGYFHAETTCLQGNNGPGIILRLRPDPRCEGTVSYPYLEIDVRELPITAHKSITIGANNLAFKCAGPKESCEQSREGEIVFDHYREPAGSNEFSRTDGSYDLKLRTGVESGRFKVDCVAPCG